MNSIHLRVSEKNIAVQVNKNGLSRGGQRVYRVQDLVQADKWRKQHKEGRKSTKKEY